MVNGEWSMGRERQVNCDGQWEGPIRSQFGTSGRYVDNKGVGIPPAYMVTGKMPNLPQELC